MRRILLTLFLVVMFSSMATAQLGNRYFHTDTITVTTSVYTITYDESWEEATIWADTVDVMLRMGAPDVGGWTSRDYIRLAQGMAFSIGPTPKLKKLSVYAISGSGVVYVAGYKKTRQY